MSTQNNFPQNHGVKRPALPRGAGGAQPPAVQSPAQARRAAELPTIGFARVRHALMTRGNALRAIDPQRLGNAIDAYRHGYVAPMARICDDLGERDDTWAIAAEKYKAAVARCTWEVRPMEGLEKDEAALAQAEAMRRVYATLTATHALKGDTRGGVRRLVKQMLDARSVGWSVHEVTVAYRGLEPCLTLTQAPLWWFEATTGCLRYLPTDYGTFGEPLLPGRWLIHGGAGIGVACAIAALYKRLSLEDWLIWSERFGQPGIHGVTSAVPDSPEWEQAVEALKAYSADWQVLTGEGVRFEPIAAGNAGAIPYPKLVERMDRAIAALWRGADLSTLSAGTGEGTGASLQGDEADMIEQDACAEISETLHTTLDRLIVDLLQGPNAPLLATFALTPQSRPDATREIAIDTHLVSLGAKLSLRDALARYGRTEADPTDPDDRALVARDAFGEQGLRAPAPAGAWAGVRLRTAPPQGAASRQSGTEDKGWANETFPHEVPEHEASPHEASRSPQADVPVGHPVGHPAPTAALQSLAEALQLDLTPAADALQALLANPSLEAARELTARLPDLLPDDPETAALLEEELANAFGDQLRQPEAQTAPAVANSAEKCPDCGQWLNADGTCTECRGADEAAAKGQNPDPVKVQTAEIGKGKAALKKCLEEQTDVHDALARGDLGTISFIYGDERRGIAHFMHRKETLEHLPETLIRGTLGAEYQQGDKRNISYGDYTAVLRLQHDEKEEHWIVTAFGPKDKKEGSPR